MSYPVEAYIEFRYLDDLIRERVSERLLAEDGESSSHYKPSSIHFPCDISEGHGCLTLMIEGTAIDNGELYIARKVSVLIKSQLNKTIEDWALCLGALFSFIFSCDVRYSYYRDLRSRTQEGAINPYYRAGVSKEIENRARDYDKVYRHIIHAFPSLCTKWVDKYFRSYAFSLGIFKYLETVIKPSTITVEIQVALTCEAFVHCFGSKAINAENAIKNSYCTLASKASIRIDNEGILDEIVEFYNNYKHITYDTRVSPDAGHPRLITASKEERIAYNAFITSLFRFALLYELLAEDIDALEIAYSHLSKVPNALMRGTAQWCELPSRNEAEKALQ